MQFDAREVARMLRVPEQQVYQWVDKEELPGAWVNGRFCVNRVDFLEWVAQRRELSKDFLKETFIDPSGDISLADALRLGGIEYDVAAGDKPTALKAIIDCLHLPPSFNRVDLFELFKARETAGSTALGDGLAIPHPRHPVILPIERPVMNLCFLAKPIEFGAADKGPVDTLFVMVCPTVPAHLSLLAQLATALHDEAFRGLIKRRASEEEILLAAERFAVDMPDATTTRK